MPAQNAPFIEIDEAVEGIHRHLRGKDPKIQGAILADCCAIWLAGHVVVGDPEGTAKLRADLLKMHVETIERLTTLNAERMGTG